MKGETSDNMAHMTIWCDVLGRDSWKHPNLETRLMKYESLHYVYVKHEYE